MNNKKNDKPKRISNVLMKWTHRGTISNSNLTMTRKMLLMNPWSHLVQDIGLI